VTLGGWEGNRGPGRMLTQPTAWFMASATCGLIAEDRDQLWNPTLVSISSMGLRTTFTPGCNIAP